MRSQEKNARSKERNRERKSVARQEAAERNEYWGKMSYEQQLERLKDRPGKCAKQIKKIKEKMTV